MKHWDNLLKDVVDSPVLIQDGLFISKICPGIDAGKHQACIKQVLDHKDPQI